MVQISKRRSRNEVTPDRASSDIMPSGSQRDYDAVLRIDSMSKRFGAKAALDGISFDVAAGEFFTIIGPSGSGKTTLLRILGGFETPDACDRFDLAGQAVAQIPAHRRNVATVFQHYALFPHMSVGENIGYGLKVRGVRAAERKRRAVELLATVRLPDAYDRTVGTLSGGERQRVALARALVVEPAILLLDEPLGALDEKLRAEMQFELKRVQEAVGVTFIYVTHNQDEALTMSDRLAILHNGRLEQTAPPHEVYARPASRFVAEFMGAANFLDVTVESSDQSGLTVDYRGVSLRANGPAGRDFAPGTSAWLTVRPEDVTLSTMSAGTPHGSLAGTVDRLAYRGAFVEMYLTLGQGDQVVARVRDAPSMAVGTRVAIAFAPESTWLLEK